MRQEIVGYMVNFRLISQHLMKDGTLNGVAGHHPCLFSSYGAAKKAVRKTVRKWKDEGRHVENNWVEGMGSYVITAVISERTPH